MGPPPLEASADRLEAAVFAVKHVTDERGDVVIQDPPIARFLFQNTKASVLWLIVRLYVAYDWLEAGWHKFTDPAWMGDGSGILGFWQRALAVTNGKPVITYDWYRNFIQYLVDTNSAVWFSKLIVFGELAVAVGLILGAFTYLAAAGGLLMSQAYLLAGTTATGPILALLEVLLIVAWKNAGYIGLDRFLLPLLGTPWWRPQQQSARRPDEPDGPGTGSLR